MIISCRCEINKEMKAKDDKKKKKKKQKEEDDKYEDEFEPDLDDEGDGEMLICIECNTCMSYPY